MKPTHRLPILVFLSALIALVFSALATAAEGQTPPSAPVVALANAGQTATFFVTSVQGSAPFAYALFKNGQQITASVGNTYLVSNIGPTDAGVYYFLISNSAGQVLSAPLVLVTPPALPVLPPAPVAPSNPAVTSTVK